MKLYEIFLIAIGLGMDSFAVAICKGLAMKNMQIKKAVIIGLYFGIFQGAMPIIGYFLGVKFQDVIIFIDHWIAFILLGAIGINMLKHAFSVEEEYFNDNVDFRTMIVLAIATSIDALAVGITFAFLKANIIFSVCIIGSTAFILSIIGVKIGNIFGNKYERISEIFGGCILIFIGIKTLIEHFF